MHPRTRRSALAIPLALALAACAAARPPRVLRETPRLRTVTLSPAPATPAFLPATGDLTLIDEHGDERNYLAGALRARLTGHDATLGDQPFAAAIVSATRVESGWVFVSNDGVVAAASTFTGSLLRRGQTPLFAPHGVRASHGRAVVIDGTGVVWSTDGALDVAPVTPLVGRPIDAAAFVDALHGAALTREHELLTTADGGATWQPVALANLTVSDVALAGEALVVTTSDGARTLDAAGTLAASTAATPPAPVAPAGDASRALEATLAAYPDRLVNLEGVRRDDGLAVFVDHDALVVVAAADARVQRRVTGLALRGCGLAAWGPEVAVVCDGEDDGPRAYRFDNTAAVPIETPANAREAVFSDDALHAARRHACSGERGDDASLCVLRDGVRDWRTVRAAAPLERLTAMRGTTILARTTEHHIVAVDAESGALGAVAVLHEGAPLAPVFLAFTRDGGYAGSADDAEAHHFALLGASIAELRALPLPRGAIVCGFVDQRHGVAAGRTSGQVWRTLDGARTWEHVDLGIDGLTREVPLLPQPDAIYGAVACTELGCTVGHAASIRGWGALVAPARHVLAPLAPPPTPEAPPAPAPPPAAAPRHRRHRGHRHHHAH